MTHVNQRESTLSEAAQVMTASPDSTSPTYHWLVVKDEKGMHEVPLTHPRYLIGRSPEADIKLADSYFISRFHATLVQVPERDGRFAYRIEDGTGQQPSSNGLLINGDRLRSRTLRHGDRIVFGPLVEAIYHCETKLPDPFDITLVSPDRADLSPIDEGELAEPLPIAGQTSDEGDTEAEVVTRPLDDPGLHENIQN